jgi:hypothetical protein
MQQIDFIGHAEEPVPVQACACMQIWWQLMNHSSQTYDIR